MKCVCSSCSRPAREDGYCTGHSPANQRAKRKENAVRYKGYSLQRDYGISSAQFEAMLLVQNGLCAVCGVPDGSERSNNNGSKRLSVDHDHKTGVVRGLLCSSCNKGIGLLMDNSDLLRLAATYLETYSTKADLAVALAKAMIEQVKSS